MSADASYLATLARYRAHLERQGRLGFKVKTKLQALAVSEARARDGVTPPKPIAQAVEITEGQIREAARQLHEGNARGHACKRKFEFV